MVDIVSVTAQVVFVFASLGLFYNFYYSLRADPGFVKTSRTDKVDVSALGGATGGGGGGSGARGGTGLGGGGGAGLGGGSRLGGAG